MLKPFPLFGDHCIFPMDRELRIFGEADEESVVRATLRDTDGSPLETGCCEARGGRFLVLLPAVCDALTGLSLEISDGAETYTARDIATGLVFLAGGQSNMELPLCNADEGKDIIAAHEDPDLRWYMVPKESVPAKADAAQPGCRWEPMTPGSSPEMSGVGYFFAARLRRQLNLPIGIIGCYWGGTSVTAWMDEEALRQSAEGTRYLTEYAAQAGDKTMETWQAEEDVFEAAMDVWNKKVEEVRAAHPGIEWEDIEAQAGKCPWFPPVGPGSQYRPAGLAETMLKRVTPAALTAFLYYQGEDDTTRTDRYDLLLAGMVRRWRELFQNQELPFINMQLPMWIEKGHEEDYAWPRTRMAQHRVWRETRHSALTCLIDCGEFNNIHPTDKRTPGERMADEYLALAGDEAAALRLPPTALSKRTEDSTLTVLLDQPVHTVGGPADLFEVAGADGIFHPANAVIRQGTEIVLSSEEVPYPMAARYAYVSWAKVHVFGDNGMPLRPFEME